MKEDTQQTGPLARLEVLADIGADKQVADTVAQGASAHYHDAVKDANTNFVAPDGSGKCAAGV
jgi:hypothetical protein